MATRESRTRSDVEQLAGYESGHNAPVRATEKALADAETAESVVLVEGISDQIAVDALLARFARHGETEDTARARVVVVPIGGAHAAKLYVGRFAERAGVTVSGLCDEQERSDFAPAFAEYDLEHAVAVCAPDLEAELIRAFEPAELEALIDGEGELGALRTMQKQAAWRDRPFDQQLHRWIRSRSRRSSRYAKLLVEAAHDDRVPSPLLELLDHI